MSTAEIALQNVRNGGRLVLGLKHFFSFIVVICLIMAIPLIYVWPHVRMTELEYRIAEEMNIRQKLLEERNKLKIEHATLKSPQRIEAIARTKLQMTYPKREQVVYLK
jgi:cell division protein FtsL